jgi:acyl-CoA thioester hydrolase
VPEPFIHRLRVRYSECDLQGVLFNANYLAYVDHTITELWRAAYGGYTVMLGRGADIVVAEATLRFRGAARFDEEITVEATVAHLGTTSIVTAHRFLRGDDGQLLLEAEVRHVWIDPVTRAKTPMPDWAREGLAPWYVPAAQQPRRTADP